MSDESGESTVIQLNVMRIAHLKAFRTLKTDLTGMGTKIQMTAIMMAQWTVNLIWSKTVA
jgi:hypothetical protein